MDLEAITLPAHTHTAGLWTDPAPPTGTAPDHLIVWADRPYRACPQCALPVPRDPGCPVTITDGAVTELPQQHTCGATLPVTWQAISPDPETGEFSKRHLRRVPDQVLYQWKERATAAREHTRGELLRDLGVALSQLSAPENPGTGDTYDSRADQVTTGSAEQPGVWFHGDTWYAWNYDPGSDSNDDRVTVTSTDVAEHWKMMQAEISQ